MNQTEKQLNPAHVAGIARIVNSCPYFSLLSLELEELGWGLSRLVARLAEKHLQPYGIVHGGVFASLMDAAAFWAAYTQLDDQRALTTVEIKLNYLAPAVSGVLLARGRCLKSGRTLSLAEASIEDGQGRLLAHGTSTLMVLDSLEIQGQAQLPPKYL